MPAPQFTVVRSLGGGGMADVSLARMRLDGKESWVALKRLRSSLAADAAHRLQFAREGQLGALLSHPNIVAVRCAGEDETGPFLALEFIDGPTVAALLKGNGGRSEVLPLELVLAVIADVTDALHYAHAFVERPGAPPGVIHRDVAPDNVLVATAGIAKLADFGIARAVDATHLTATGAVHGKLRFMAPELFEGSPHTTGTDRYALAGTLFEMLTGVPPFTAPNDADLMKRILSQVPPRPDLLRPEVPVAIAEWVEAALHKRVAERPADLLGLTRLLEAAVGKREQRQLIIARHLTTLAPARPALPATLPPAATRSSSRRIFLVAAVTGLAVTVVAGLALLPLAPNAAPTAAAPIAAAPTPSTAPAAPVATEPEPEPEPEPAAPAGQRRLGDGSLWVRVRPWAEVVVDGKSFGQTPLSPVKLSSGKHTVVLVNGPLGVRKSYAVRISPGQRSELKVVLSDGSAQGAPSTP